MNQEKPKQKMDIVFIISIFMLIVSISLFFLFLYKNIAPN